MSNKHLCVAIYMTYDQAEEAFSRLQVEGSNMDILSFVGRDYWDGMIGSRNAGERFLYLGDQGPFWERLWSVLRGWGVFWFFENGPVLVAGPLVRTIIATQEQGNGHQGISWFVKALSDIGIPEDNLVLYERALLRDQVLLFVQGTLDEVYRAQELLNETKAINHTVHHNSTN